MAYEMVMPYPLHMPSYFLETFTEYPDFTVFCFSSKWCHQESNNTIQSPNLQYFNIFGKIPEPLNQPYAKFTNFR